MFKSKKEEDAHEGEEAQKVQNPDSFVAFWMDYSSTRKLKSKQINK